MTPKLTRRPSRAAVDRALRECAMLWRPPDKVTAEPEGNPVSAAEERKEQAKDTPGRAAPQRRQP